MTIISEEAIGIVRAAKKSDVDVVISFTVETDGRLPNGQKLKVTKDLHLKFDPHWIENRGRYCLKPWNKLFVWQGPINFSLGLLIQLYNVLRLYLKFKRAFSAKDKAHVHGYRSVMWLVPNTGILITLPAKIVKVQSSDNFPARNNSFSVPRILPELHTR